MVASHCGQWSIQNERIKIQPVRLIDWEFRFHLPPPAKRKHGLLWRSNHPCSLGYTVELGISNFQASTWIKMNSYSLLISICQDSRVFNNLSRSKKLWQRYYLNVRANTCNTSPSDNIRMPDPRSNNNSYFRRKQYQKRYQYKFGAADPTQSSECSRRLHPVWRVRRATLP